MVIAGDDDMAAGAVSFRYRDGRQDNGVPIDEAIQRVTEAVARGPRSDRGGPAVGDPGGPRRGPAGAPGVLVRVRPDARRRTVVPEQPRPTTVVRPTQDPQTARLAALARLAEQAAADLPPRRHGPAALGRGPRRRRELAAVPARDGHPRAAHAGSADAAVGGRVRDPGLTNGPGFTANPAWPTRSRGVRERHLLASAYAVVEPARRRGGRPAPHRRPLRRRDPSRRPGQRRLPAGARERRHDAQGGAHDAGRLGRRRAGPRLRVERRPGDQRGRRRGCGPGLPLRGYRVGIYSTPALWEGRRRPALGLPEWRAAGQTSREEARRRCGDDWSIQGGNRRPGPVGRDRARPGL